MDLLESIEEIMPKEDFNEVLITRKARNEYFIQLKKETVNLFLEVLEDIMSLKGDDKNSCYKTAQKYYFELGGK